MLMNYSTTDMRLFSVSSVVISFAKRINTHYMNIRFQYYKQLESCVLSIASNMKIRSFHTINLFTRFMLDLRCDIT